jgi:polyhydroxyalkanoate synthase
VVGENLACSSGEVIYRNDLIELIQYTPTTKTVHEIPLLLCPPWINKYYIFDMAPGKSLVEWAVNHGMTTFAISYRNPGSAQRKLSFEDYLTLGPRAALEAVRAITGSPTVNAVSACIGGTLTTAMLAHLKALGESEVVNSSTLLNCLVDHEDAGTLSAVYADEQTIAGIERKMAATGYLEAGDMAHTFDLLRANDLVFRYLRSNWLNGKPPAAFDLLAWNGDSTRMPAQMQSDYLRSCWLENALAKNEMVLYGQPLRVSDIDTDTYIVAAADDHIVPWRCSYRTVGLLAGDVRFVLSSSGHIAGIINPPSPKARLWTNDQLGRDPDAWLDGAEKAEKSWWEDWAEWIEPRSGKLVTPPSMGDAAHPVLCPAPGTFVHAR